MSDTKEDTSIETLSQEIVQKLVGKAILEVRENSNRYFDIFAEGVSEETTIAELAINAITKMKTVETTILTTLCTIMKENGVPPGGMKFISCMCKDITLSLMLLNELVSPENLLEIYEESDIENPLRVFKEEADNNSAEQINIQELTRDLKEFLDKKHQPPS